MSIYKHLGNSIVINTKAVLYSFSDVFYRLVIFVFIYKIFFMSVLTNLRLFQIDHFQSFYNETVMNNRIAN